MTSAIFGGTGLEQLGARFCATPELLSEVLNPIHFQIETLGTEIVREPGEKHYKVGFTVRVPREHRHAIACGRTGKFIPAVGSWREIAKGRILGVQDDLAYGEVYTGFGNKKEHLIEALGVLRPGDVLEIDPYGIMPKLLSALTEGHLTRYFEKLGYEVVRMPEDMAKHLGSYRNYDFEVSRDGITKKVESKSLWGTDTRYARLIHSTTPRPKGDETSWTAVQQANYYPTSSCKFTTQHIIAVNLFLRTGRIEDFAFARSVPKDVAPYGLPRASKYPDHINQNPLCQPGDGTWFSDFNEVWRLP